LSKLMVSSEKLHQRPKIFQLQKVILLTMTEPIHEFLIDLLEDLKEGRMLSLLGMQ
jgi:hypothetical protein